MSGGSKTKRTTAKRKRADVRGAVRVYWSSGVSVARAAVLCGDAVADVEHAYAELDAEQRRDIEYNRAIEQHIQDLQDRRGPILEWLENLRVWCNAGQEPPRTATDLDRAMRLAGDFAATSQRVLAFDRQISELRAQLKPVGDPGAGREPARVDIHIYNEDGDEPQAKGDGK